VREVLRAVEEVTGEKAPFVMGPRREGDAPRLVADAARLSQALGWKPQFTDLRKIVASAWNLRGEERSPDRTRLVKEIARHLGVTVRTARSGKRSGGCREAVERPQG